MIQPKVSLCNLINFLQHSICSEEERTFYFYISNPGINLKQTQKPSAKYEDFNIYPIYLNNCRFQKY